MNEEQNNQNGCKAVGNQIPGEPLSTEGARSRNGPAIR